MNARLFLRCNGGCGVLDFLHTMRDQGVPFIFLFRHFVISSRRLLDVIGEDPLPRLEQTIFIRKRDLALVVLMCPDTIEIVVNRPQYGYDP